MAFFVLFAALDQYIEVVRWGVDQEFRRVLLSNDDYENLLFNFIRLQYLITYGKDIDGIFKITQGVTS